MRMHFYLFALGVLAAAQPATAADSVQSRVLATLRTSTMENELNRAAEDGYRFAAVMGGETAVGGKEVVVVVTRRPEDRGRFAYRLLATKKTSTMEKEIRDAAGAGYEYKGQTVFESAFGGKEVVVIMERDKEIERHSDYRLVATRKTSTLEKELKESGEVGFQVVGLTVGETEFAGKELVAILKR